MRRTDAPQVGAQRIERPNFRTLRAVAMPWARLEIAERFAIHVIELSKQLDHMAVRIFVVRLSRSTTDRPITFV